LNGDSNVALFKQFQVRAIDPEKFTKDMSFSIAEKKFVRSA